MKSFFSVPVTETSKVSGGHHCLRITSAAPFAAAEAAGQPPRPAAAAGESLAGAGMTAQHGRQPWHPATIPPAPTISAGRRQRQNAKISTLCGAGDSLRSPRGISGGWAEIFFSDCTYLLAELYPTMFTESVVTTNSLIDEYCQKV